MINASLQQKRSSETSASVGEHRMSADVERGVPGKQQGLLENWLGGKGAACRALGSDTCFILELCGA